MVTLAQFCDDYFDMLLPRAAQQEFFCLRIARKTQGEIFLQNLVDGDAYAVFVGARLRFDCEGNRRLGNPRARIKNRRVLVSQGLTGRGVLQFGDRTNVTRVEVAHRCRRFSLHYLDMLKTFLRAAIEVVERSVVFQHPGHDFEIGDAAGEGIGERLKNENRSGLGIHNLALDGVAFMV